MIELPERRVDLILARLNVKLARQWFEPVKVWSEHTQPRCLMVQQHENPPPFCVPHEMKLTHPRRVGHRIAKTWWCDYHGSVWWRIA